MREPGGVLSSGHGCQSALGDSKPYGLAGAALVYTLGLVDAAAMGEGSMSWFCF